MIGGFGGGRGGGRDKGERIKRPTITFPDKDSNYARYYQHDGNFHIQVIEKENGPFDFKMKFFRYRKAENYNELLTQEDESDCVKEIKNYSSG